MTKPTDAVKNRRWDGIKHWSLFLIQLGTLYVAYTTLKETHWNEETRQWDRQKMLRGEQKWKLELRRYSDSLQTASTNLALRQQELQTATKNLEVNQQKLKVDQETLLEAQKRTAIETEKMRSELSVYAQKQDITLQRWNLMQDRIEKTEHGRKAEDVRVSRLIANVEEKERVRRSLNDTFHKLMNTVWMLRGAGMIQHGWIQSYNQAWPIFSKKPFYLERITHCDNLILLDYAEYLKESSQFQNSLLDCKAVFPPTTGKKALECMGHLGRLDPTGFPDDIVTNTTSTTQTATYKGDKQAPWSNRPAGISPLNMAYSSLLVDVENDLNQSKQNLEFFGVSIAAPSSVGSISVPTGSSGQKKWSSGGVSAPTNNVPRSGAGSLPAPITPSTIVPPSTGSTFKKK